ncbi:hypothetical protein AAEU32_12875 [Pseudoalteromonas sp. SSDWG2]|uniref:hypothetical protein n=1 Tax=Pseudoalteromonas sp. SSDWG2 TaxID=3139391 RepID=UPI003BAC99CC
MVMKFYFAVPILLSVVLAILSVLVRKSDLYSTLIVLVGGAMLYSAPYIVWALFSVLAKPVVKVVHAGYIGATLSLVVISSLWLLPQDPSGLPVQWMAYWPLSGILITMFALITFVYIRVRGT